MGSLSNWISSLKGRQSSRKTQLAEFRFANADCPAPYAGCELRKYSRAGLQRPTFNFRKGWTQGGASSEIGESWTKC